MLTKNNPSMILNYAQAKPWFRTSIYRWCLPANETNRTSASVSMHWCYFDSVQIIGLPSTELVLLSLTLEWLPNSLQGGCLSLLPLNLFIKKEKPNAFFCISQAATVIFKTSKWNQAGKCCTPHPLQGKHLLWFWKYFWSCFSVHFAG